MPTGPSSALGYWIYYDDQAFDADYPVSAGYAFFLRNNVAHLIDSSGQYGIHWLGDHTRDSELSSIYDLPSFNHTATNGPRAWSQTFAWQPLQNSFPGFDIRIAAAADVAAAGLGATLELDARIVSPFQPFFSGSAEVLWEGSGSTASNTPSWVIDEQLLGLDSRALARFRVPTPGTERILNANTARDPDHYFATLEVRLNYVGDFGYPGGGLDSWINGVQVRQFPIRFP